MTNSYNHTNEDAQYAAAKLLDARGIDYEDRGFGFMVYGRYGRFMTPGEVMSVVVGIPAS